MVYHAFRPDQLDAWHTMNTRRMLCGWVNFGEERLAARSGLDAMLGPDHAGIVPELIELPGGSCIAHGATATSASFDPATGCAAVLVGAPRWKDPQRDGIARRRGYAVTVTEHYCDVGARMLQDLQGSFALVLIDASARRALLAVDRTGIERICFAHVGSTLVFSTSALAVAKFPAVQAAVSRQALYEYLYCHMVPSPDTVFTGVEKLLPAQQLTADADRVSRHHYWTMSFSSGHETNTDKKDEFRKLLRQAVDRQVDDRPAGAFLSGGTDSSTVSGMLGEITGKPAQTFSIGFDAEGFDELDYARITSRHFGTTAHEFYVTPQHVAEAMPLIAAAYDEPFGNASAVPTYFCAKFAREQGIEVMLAGDGGDEFFGGNVRYAKQGVFEYFQDLPRALRALLEPSIMHFPMGASLMPVRKARSYLAQARIPLPDRLESYNFLHRSPLSEIFDEKFLHSIDIDRPLALMREAYFRAASPHAIDRMMHLDHKVTLADNDLRKVGRMCELAGVEVRYPFLDDDLVTFSGTLTVRQKVRGTRLRAFFKDALKDFLPPDTIRKSKHGFGLPFGLWLATDGPLRSLVRNALVTLGQRGIVRPEYIDLLWREHSSTHASYYGVMLWVLTQLELWLEHHGVELPH